MQGANRGGRSSANVLFDQDRSAIDARQGCKVANHASIVILFVFGGLTFLDTHRISENLPTPHGGIWERINVGVFLLWVVVLASTLWRVGDPKSGGPTVKSR